MKTSDASEPSGSIPSKEADGHRLAALERLIAYARDEAQRLNADVLAFCLDASLSVARGEARDLAVAPRSAKRRGNRTKQPLPH